MSTKKIQQESDLLHLAADGDREAYGRLYTHYYDALFNSLVFLTKSETEAEELIQEAYVKAWISRETLMLVRSFADYIFTIAKNLRIDKLRKVQSRAHAETTYQAHQPAAAPLSDELYLYKQYYEAASTALDQLSERKRSIFLLRTQEGLTLDEIAAREGVSRSAVKKHLYAALEQLKAALIKQGDWLTALLILWHHLHEK